MGVSENSVPINPMVFMIIIPTKWLFHWGYTPFSDIPIFKRILRNSQSVFVPSCHWAMAPDPKMREF